MMKVILVLAIVCFTGLHAATFYSCGWVVDARVNCTTFEDEATCGTDGVTYKNKCTFSQAHCFDRDLHFAHAGACDSLATTPKPGAGGDVVLDFFCTSLSHTDCGPEVSHVCASNGRTYSNLCEYEKAKCTHRELHVVSFGDC